MLYLYSTLKISNSDESADTITTSSPRFALYRKNAKSLLRLRETKKQKKQ
uniref:Uncharacterized protein n=1 Tax=Solanum lycopersicum TaxID=4081 RepID=A0A3Q7IKZ8_SOLLC